MKPVVVDQSPGTILSVTGKDRQRFLQGMLSNDVALADSGFCRAAILSPKGRVLSVVDVVSHGDSYLVMSEASTAQKTREVFERHAIMDDVAFASIDLVIHRVWDDPASVWTAPPVFAACEPSSPEEIEVRRIEAGLPRYGVDVSEDYFPFEANLECAISYTKGCYVGQEVVARAHARGHANKRLVGLRLDGAASPGNKIFAGDKDVGVVTSAASSPDFGAIALGYVHRSSFEPETAVWVGERRGVVAALPFRARPTS